MKEEMKKLVSQFIQETEEERQYEDDGYMRERKATFDDFIRWLGKK